MLVVLTLVLTVGAVLIWTIDEQPGQTGRGLVMIGLALFTLTIALVLRRLARGSRAAEAPADEARAARNAQATSWRRQRLGPPWLDWLAPLAPVVLIGLPLALMAERWDGETWLAIGGVVGLIELLVLPAFIGARREPVAIALVSGGVRVTRRNGKTQMIGAGELRRVRLEVRTVRGFSYGRMVLEIEGGESIVFREPMDAALPTIAERLSAHGLCELAS